MAALIEQGITDAATQNVTNALVGAKLTKLKDAIRPLGRQTYA
ncbi:uncharacterized protein ARMOST_22237 [Armillaria ostoyae]|uniref:Uncharacterized protein n=1 Tax=Armillaria ostoyae TaxID=47428 RepID=A0A284SCC6_ARMOS|nr:uncharacterized protein ARMOST_22237 [Armillaria ostoyae]